MAITTTTEPQEAQHLLVDWEGGQRLFTGQVPRVDELVQFAKDGATVNGQVAVVLWELTKRPPRAMVRVNRFDDSEVKALLKP